MRVEGVRLGITRAGVKDVAGHLHAPKGLGKLSGRFVADELQAVLHQAAEYDDPRPALSKLRLDHLKDLSVHAGLPKTGRKADLVDRLAEHVTAGPKAKPTAAKKAAPRKTAKATRPPATPVDIHALFGADDATIEAALRDVYEGKFGPYTTKVTVHIRRAGTRVDKRGKVHEVEAFVGVDGKIYDADGEIGYFSRSISPSEQHYGDGTVRREVWAEHEVVQLGSGEDETGREDTRYHGKGFGGAFNQRAIDWYRASGVHGISQNDTNFYVWASQGFNFSGGVMPDYKQDELRELIASLRAGKTKNKHGETIPRQIRAAPDLDAQIAEAETLLARLASTKPGEPGYPTAYEVSQLGRNGRRGKTKTWLGKYLKVSADQMILNPDEGEVISARAA